MFNSIKIFPLLSAAAILALAGCNRERPDTDIYIGLDNGIADGSYQDMMNVVSQQAASTGFNGVAPETGNARIADCPTTTFSEPFGTFPNTMTIDFGTSCTGYLGIERSGKIIATFTGPYAEAGTVITVVPEDYYVNGNKVEGTKTVTNLGLNDDGNLYFEVIVADALITLATGETISWESSRVRTWIAGNGTPEIEDDVYSISDGIAAEYAVTGINRNGTPFSAHIAEPLIRALDCRWMKSGVLEIYPEGFETRSIDYGDGTCDNTATLTVGDFVTEITLPY